MSKPAIMIVLGLIMASICFMAAAVVNLDAAQAHTCSTGLGKCRVA